MGSIVSDGRMGSTIFNTRAESSIYQQHNPTESIIEEPAYEICEETPVQTIDWHDLAATCRDAKATARSRSLLFRTEYTQADQEDMDVAKK